MTQADTKRRQAPAAGASGAYATTGAGAGEGARPPAISVRELSIAYGADVILRGVNLDVRPGRVTALIGPSGCGKTSLLQALNRLTDLIPGCRVGGAAHAAGIDVTAAGCDVDALRRNVGMIFQRANPFPLSVRANVELALRDHGLRDCRALREATKRALRDVGLWDEVRHRLNAPARRLSGGQQQRLCIARALALEPRVLLMDEPCGALDPLSTETIEGLIDRLRADYTIVIVTHNLAQARRVADDVAMFWMDDGCGRLVEVGTSEQILDRPAHAATRQFVAGTRG